MLFPKSTIFALAFLSLMGMQADADEPKKIAFLVGVSDYFDKNMEDLNYAENDVNVIADELEKLGFVVSKLTGRSVTKSTVDSRIDSFMNAAARLENDDIVFVMFSGHGQELRVQQTKTVLVDGKEKAIRKIGEVPYFCPRDAIPFDSAKHDLRGKTEDEVGEEFKLISLNKVIGFLDSRSNSLRNLLIVDACRNNPAKGKSANVTGSVTRELPRGLSILFAAKSGQKSWESSDLKIKHGVMSHFLIEGLRGRAKDDRNEITWTDLTNFAKKSVIRDQGKLAGGSDRRQNPHTINSSDDVIILGKFASKKLKPRLLFTPFDRSEASAAQKRWADYYETSVSRRDSIGMNLVMIPAGEFRMGNDESVDEIMKAFSNLKSIKREYFTDAEPHRVEITQPFLMSRFEVSVKQFKDFVNDSGYKTEAETDGEGGWGYDSEQKELVGRKKEFTWKNTGFRQSDSDPVVNVTWNDADKFCKWLTKKEGRTYRLPTEAEWEYACRAGTQMRYSFGNNPADLAKYSNTWDSSTKEKLPNYVNRLDGNDGYPFTSPVGMFASNNFGLNDMHGNVREWCLDYYASDYYQTGPRRDPVNSTKSSSRVLRGGSWVGDSFDCRSAARVSNAASRRGYGMGFRVVCEYD